MTLKGRRYGRILLALIVLGALIWFGVRALHDRARTTVASVPDNAKPPQGVRIKVEVLNATRTPGLARRATQLLRELGFDVVGSGTNPDRMANTLVLDRSAHPDWAARVGRAMNATVLERPDSSRYLDVTVILGADWRAPALPFHP
ncbi:MAG: LytR C-terminal domain-containing protein [Gemmatimonadaceae bacterium]